MQLMVLAMLSADSCTVSHPSCSVKTMGGWVRRRVVRLCLPLPQPPAAASYSELIVQRLAAHPQCFG